MAINKVILVYAHGGTKPNDPGAVNTAKGVKERDFIANFFDKFVIPAFKEAKIPYAAVKESPNWYAIDKQVDSVYEKNDIAISCHLNANSNATATGIETLYATGSTNGLKLATLVQAELVKALGLKDRGLEGITRDDRGGRLVAGTKPPCVLAELFFLSNETDLATGTAKQAEMAKALVAAIKAF